MDTTRTQTVDRSPLALLVALLVGLGFARAVTRLAGLAALLGVVIATVAALGIGIVVLRLVLLH
jgi:hypothetical protein